jgi:hypothetical protein
METYGEVEIQVHTSLTSAVDGGEWSASRHCDLTPREAAPGTHWRRGGSVGSRIRLDPVKKGKVSCACRQTNHYSSVAQPLS